jgi:hypothetical protein
MSERPPKFESGPHAPGIDAFEKLVNEGQWNTEVEKALEELLEKYEIDLYMLYLNYVESGIVEELPEHERQMFERLEVEFKDRK